ncbi:MAG: glycosyltransferase family 4 protein [Thermoguttaceae bacterium]|nr:glycosyltransferase family 4 protein [Thermoguttaceae bacterium]
MRIAVVTPIPTPYRDPFWNVVAAQPGVELEVFYCSAGKADRPWQVDWQRRFHSEVLPGVNLAAWRGADASCQWNPAIVSRLKAGRYDAIIVGGYNHPTMWAAMRCARRSGVPYFLMCESHLRRRRGTVRRWIKEYVVRRAVQGAAGLFPTGQLAREYLLHYGARPENIELLPNVPDVEALAETASRLRPERRSLRRRLGLDGCFVVLFAGRLIPKKRPGLLLRAFRQIPNSVNARLVIVGDGPLRGELEQTARDFGLEDSVLFPGFVQPPAMPEWYAAADLFVLPSSETWGVVVIEALASGLPVVVSDEVGCHPDVVTEAVGTVVAARDEAALAGALRQHAEQAEADEGARAVRQRVLESLTYKRLAIRMISLIASRLLCTVDCRNPAVCGRKSAAARTTSFSHERARADV